jgi:hypothetical protein
MIIWAVVETGSGNFIAAFSSLERAEEFLSKNSLGGLLIIEHELDTEKPW